MVSGDITGGVFALHPFICIVLKAGLPDEKIFCTQGDYFYTQCSTGCHNKTYDAVDLFHQMDNYFVQDDAWFEAERRFSDYLSEAIDKNLVLLELGVGFNTPTIIRFPFEKLVREHDNISLIRLNLEQAVVPESFGSRAVGINADMAESIKDIVEEVKRR